LAARKGFTSFSASDRFSSSRQRSALDGQARH
jgi:hypothetical protein